MYGTSRARLIQLTDDQIKLIAHALCQVDPDHLDFKPEEPFLGTVPEELTSLQRMFADDYSQCSRSTILGFCL